MKYKWYNIEVPETKSSRLKCLNGDLGAYDKDKENLNTFLSISRQLWE